MMMGYGEDGDKSYGEGLSSGSNRSWIQDLHKPMQ